MFSFLMNRLLSIFNDIIYLFRIFHLNSNFSRLIVIIVILFFMTIPWDMISSFPRTLFFIVCQTLFFDECKAFWILTCPENFYFGILICAFGDSFPAFSLFWFLLSDLMIIVRIWHFGVWYKSCVSLTIWRQIYWMSPSKRLQEMSFLEDIAMHVKYWNRCQI